MRVAIERWTASARSGGQVRPTVEQGTMRCAVSPQGGRQPSRPEVARSGSSCFFGTDPGESGHLKSRWGRDPRSSWSRRPPHRCAFPGATLNRVGAPLIGSTSPTSTSTAWPPPNPLNRSGRSGSRRRPPRGHPPAEAIPVETEAEPAVDPMEQLAKLGALKDQRVLKTSSPPKATRPLDRCNRPKV